MYHRHIIGYEGISESTCFGINSVLPEGKPLTRFPKKFAEAIAFPT